MADGRMNRRAACRSGDQPALNRRQVLRAMLLGAAGLAVPAACGLPTGGHAIVDGPAKTTQPGSGDTAQKAPTADGVTSPTGLVTAFFGAVAGRIHNDDDLTTANDRAQSFLTAKAKASWPPLTNGITVVHLNPDFSQSIGTEGTLVTVTVKPTGTLKVDGTVWPLDPNPGVGRLTFTVVPNPVGPGYRIDDIEPADSLALPGMMLDSAELDGRLFSTQLLYFWSTDGTGLVPDLRYVGKAAASQEIQFTDVVDWILQGPSSFLQDAVQANLYNGNGLVLPNLPAADRDGLVVNLTLPPPKTLNKEQVMAQLRWSLRPLYEGTVRLEVASQAQNVDGSAASTVFRHWNLADQSRDQSVYCVANGVVRPVDNPTNVPAILPDDTNKDVYLAALSPDLKGAALVKTDGKLYVNELQAPSKPFNVATLNGQPLFPGAGQTAKWTRPMYLPSGHRVLVGLGGSLYLVHPDGKAIQLQTPGSIQVSAFALAPDGRRIALISGGVPFIYSLKVNGDDVSFGGLPRQIDAGLTGCTGIAWARLDRVLIAGRRGDQYQIVESTIDGAILSDFGAPFATEIRSIAALPPVAWDWITGPEEALVQISPSDARQVFAGTTSTPAAIAFIYPPGAQPSPTASGAAQGASPLGTPTYPFYLG